MLKSGEGNIMDYSCVYGMINKSCLEILDKIICEYLCGI